MATFTTTDGTEIFYKDWGAGLPLFFHHGWPLSADDWDSQMMFFLEHGYRVIAHDRRAHGRSTQTFLGHDMDTYAADVAELVEALDLKNPVHIGHSTGGGEVTIPFYGFNRPGAVVSEGIRENWWRQGMMGSATAHCQCVKVLSE